MFEINTTIIWAIIGLVLIIVEILTTTFFLLFFGVSALLVALIKLFGLQNLPIEVITFAVLGVAGTFVFRSKILHNFKSSASLETDKSKTIIMTEDIAAGKIGSVMYQGSPWQAINTADKDFKKGDTAVIERVDGVKLVLKS